MDERINEITKFCHYTYMPIDDPESKEKIYNLLSDGTTFRPESYLEFHYIDLYNNNKLYISIISGYLKEVDKGNTKAMIELVGYYEKKHKRFKTDLIIKYYEMAIERGNIDAMISLAQFYREMPKKDNEVIKYYEMAIEKGSCHAMNFIGQYYLKYGRFDLMMKYFLMAIDKGHLTAMLDLGNYYKKIKEYHNMQKYYMMAIEKGHTESMKALGHYYYSTKEYNLMKQYMMMAIKKNDKGALIYMLTYYFERDMYIEYLKLYMRYSEINDIITISYINLIIRKKLYVNGEAEFIKILIQYGTHKNNNILKDTGIFTCLIANSMIDLTDTK